MTYTFVSKSAADLLSVTARSWGFECFAPAGYFAYTLTFRA